MTQILIEWVIKTVVILLVLVTAVAYVTLMERKVMGWIQLRIGPNRVGPLGLLQPLADGLKMIFKEDIVPLEANRWLYILAPALSFVPAMMAFIVVPYGSQIELFGYRVELHVTRMNIALLYIFALTSVGVYGIVLAGWSSNNKYSLMGGLRSSAQMISYELAMGLSIVSVLLCTGSLDLVQIVDQQSFWPNHPDWRGHLAWNIFQYPWLILVFVVFYISSLAETNRTPFDLPEADSELVAGYHTEYSSMKFVMFQMAEYLNLITAASIATTLFFGGWNGPFVGRLPLLGPVYFALKALAMIFTAMWIRYTVPRFRYDQLMRFGWSTLLPLSIVNIIISSTLLLFWH